MAKKKVSTGQTPNQVVINDFGIEVRTIDRSPKDLARWKNALLSAENILNPNRKPLYDIYEDITLDEHLTSVMDQRRLSLTNSSLIFQKDGQEVEAVQQIINSLAFEKLLTYIVDSKFYGYSLIHVDFTHPDGPTVDLVPRPHVVPTRGLVIATPGDMSGYAYTEPPFTNLYLGVGEANDLGLLLKATPLVLMKRGNVNDWVSFNEVFGQPLRKGTYSPGDPAQKAQLEHALANMGSMAYVVVPEGSNLEIVGNYQSASADTYNKLTDHFDKAISKLIVGQTMTTESGASLSQSEVHERVADKVGSSDRRYVLKVLESKVKAMLIAQGIPADGNFQFVEEEQDLNKKDRLEGDLKIHQYVGPLTKQYFAEEYNVTFTDMTDQEPVDDTDPDPKSTDGKKKGEKPTKEKPTKGKQNNRADGPTSPFGVRGLLTTLQSFFDQAPIQ